MNIHIALADREPGPQWAAEQSAQSWVIGAFSNDEKAMAACQEYDEPAIPLQWNDYEAQAFGIKYAIVQVELDVPV